MARRVAVQARAWLAVGLLLTACTTAAPDAASPTASPATTNSPSPATATTTPPPASATTTSTPTPSATPAPQPVHLVAAGDLAWCGPKEDDTAALAASLEGTVALLGDLAYDRGTADEFQRCFLPSWGVDGLRSRSRPAVGNHDAATDRARPLFDFFGGTLSGRQAATGDAAVGTWPDGWYSYDLGAWHVVVLNSNCGAAGGCAADSPQVQWLRADLAEHGGGNLLAYWHHPRFSSLAHGPDRTVQPFWDELVAAGVDVVLNGHEHGFERRLVGDVRQFIVGTGGAVLRPITRERTDDVEARFTDAYGVLHVELRACGYTWTFLEVPEQPGGTPTTRDAGEHAGTC